jgi:OHS family lactose permease-like MFS transporter
MLGCFVLAVTAISAFTLTNHRPAVVQGNSVEAS